MNVVVLILCIMLCTVNAVLWTFYAAMPFAGMGWLVMGGVSMRVRAWSMN